MLLGETYTRHEILMSYDCTDIILLMYTTEFNRVLSMAQLDQIIFCFIFLPLPHPPTYLCCHKRGLFLYEVKLAWMTGHINPHRFQSPFCDCICYVFHWIKIFWTWEMTFDLLGIMLYKCDTEIALTHFPWIRISQNYNLRFFTKFIVFSCFFKVHVVHGRAHTHTHLYIYIYIYVCIYSAVAPPFRKTLSRMYIVCLHVACFWVN